VDTVFRAEMHWETKCPKISPYEHAENTEKRLTTKHTSRYLRLKSI
jgi:hypothetical protein